MPSRPLHEVLPEPAGDVPPHTPGPTRQSSVASALILVALVGGTLVFNRWFSPNPVDLTDLGGLARRFAEITRMSTPWFWLGLGAIFALERWRPALPSQRVFSAALGYDFLWFVAEIFTNSGLLLWYGAFLWSLCDARLRFLRIDGLAEASLTGRFVIAALLIDFLGWFHHWLRHRWSWLWYFHSLHHSQTELNPLTDLRYHFVEYMFTRAVSAVPLYALGFPAPTFAAWEFGKTFFTRFYHGNIRTDLGPLRWLLVTPQSHRLHHAHAPEHHDRNFGVLLSVWDRLFGTHSDGRGEYPPTGIRDPMFPVERAEDGVRMLLTPVAQLVYPFRMIGRDVRARLRRY